MQVSCCVNDKKCVEYNDYSWSNESAEAYEQCFNGMTAKPTNLSSVGGGDHILFTLLYFDTIRVVNNIDVSPIGLLSTLVKLSVLSEGSFSDWFELLTGSIREKRLIDILEKCYTIDQYKTLINVYQDRTYGVTPLAGLRSNNMNYDILYSSFDALKNKVNRIDDLNFILRDIWTLDLMQEGIVKERSDLAVISNAYHYSTATDKLPEFIAKSIKVDGYIIASSEYTWFKDKCIHIEHHLGAAKGGWNFHLLKKLKDK